MTPFAKTIIAVAVAAAVTMPAAQAEDSASLSQEFERKFAAMRDAVIPQRHKEVCTDVPRSKAFEAARRTLIERATASKYYDKEEVESTVKAIDYAIEQVGRGPWCRAVTWQIRKQELRDNE